MSYRHRPPLPFRLISTLIVLFLSPLDGDYWVLAKCLQAQSSSLLQVKQGFLAGSSSKLDTWVSTTDCCVWGGVTCGEASAAVTGIDLSSSYISGNIHPALFNLTSLQTLNLAYNRFDSIPIPSPGFERLLNLTRLNLSNSGFSGQIPVGISRLTRLVSLDLSSLYLYSNSSLKLENPNLKTLIQNLTSLRDLYLDGVNISANGVDWGRALSSSVPNLRNLSLSSCSLTGPIYTSLSQLKFLSQLRLNGNNLSSEVPAFLGNLSSLELLRLSSCSLNGSFPDTVFKLVNLKTLDVSTNPMLSGQLPDFPQGSALESLVLSDTILFGHLPETLGNLKSLRNLQLSTCNFSGPLPTSIGNLAKLVRVDLSSNNFSGVIPSFISSAKVSELVLAHNRFTGSIPSSYGHGGLQYLTQFDLRNNSLTGSIPPPLFSLPSLQELLLNENQLSGQLGEFSNVTSLLENVDLSDNRLQGPIPKSISKLSGLKVLSLASNNFSGAVELALFVNLKNLSSLDLSYNKLTVVDGNGSSFSFPKFNTLRLASCNMTKFPSFLSTQDGITFLDLSSNRIEGVINNWIWNLGNGSLNHLNLSHNLFTDFERPLPENSMISLTVLDIHNNKLGGPILLPPPSNLVLDYSNNNFNSTIPSNIFLYMNYTIFFSLSSNSLIGNVPPSICTAGYLQVLDLSNNNLSGSIPCLKQMGADLRVLNLRGNAFHGTMPQNFEKGCKLRTINLNRNRLQGQVPISLVNCSSLEVLDLGNNDMVDIFPNWLGSLSELQVLVLRSNRFYGTIEPLPGTNYTFQKLQIMDLSSNNFTGTLSLEVIRNLKAMMDDGKYDHGTLGIKVLDFSQLYYEDTVTVTSKGLDMALVKILRVFTSIDLSNNGFNGAVPEELGELKSLLVLNMSGNHFTGQIPASIGQLKQVESLDLSRNMLYGEIPWELTSLTFLSSLNLSDNHLVGSIPQSRQFLTFQSDSFRGNEGLCGVPLPNQCSIANPPESREPALKSTIELNWGFIFTGFGVGGGLGMVFGPVVLWTKGRRWYYKHVDRMLWAVLPLTLWLSKSCGDGRVDAEERINDAMDMEEVVIGRRFCVFCTQLEFISGRVRIQHVDCSCHVEE